MRLRAVVLVTAALCATQLHGQSELGTAAGIGSSTFSGAPFDDLREFENKFAVEAVAPTKTDELELRLQELEQQATGKPTRLTSFTQATKPDVAKDASAGSIVGSDTKLSAAWKDGLSFESADKAFKARVRGRMQFDYSGFTDSDAYFQGLGGNQGQQAVDFRRLRLGTEGTFYEQFYFVLEMDFINSVNTNGSTNAFAPNNNLKNAFNRQYATIPVPIDTYIGVQEVPLFNNIRFGNVKPANGLEHTNSSRFLDFMERSVIQDAFTGRFNNGFEPGVLTWNYNKSQTATWHASITKNTYSPYAFDSGSSGWDYASRMTWTPFYDEASHGRYLLHLGFSATERSCVDGQDRLRARGALRNGLSVSKTSDADTTIFFSTNSTTLIPEATVVYGPWHFQTEYAGQWNNNVRVQQPLPAGAASAPNPGANLGTAFLQGFYLQASYFITGEHREYDRKTGSFGRVVPYENGHWIRGKAGSLVTSGAWQVLYRYELLDLNDPRLALVNAVSPGAVNGVGGGTLWGHTIGLNHFINPNMKFQYNMWFADRSANAATPINAAQPQTGGAAIGLGMRVAIDF